MSACVRCSYAHQEDELCTYSERCANCDGSHRADSKDCPEFLFFKEVAELKFTLICSRREAMCRVRERYRNQEQTGKDRDHQVDDLFGTDASHDSDEETERLRQRRESKQAKTLVKKYLYMR